VRTALASILVLALGSLACEPARRDVQVNWTFAGGQSCAAVGVATIEIDINGEYIPNNQFACGSGSSLATGVDLGRFLTGRYEIVITGFDANQNPTYLLDTEIDVVASQNPNVFDLDVPLFAAQPGGEGELTLLWTFDGKSCAQAGVSTVNVKLDGTLVTDDNGNADLPCTEGAVDGVTIGPVDSGTHTVTVTATGSDQTNYSVSLSANVADQEETQLAAALVSSNSSSGTATAELSWSFAGMSCAQAQVDSVHVLVDGTDTGAVACTTSGVDGASVAGVSAGAHTISIQAIRGTGGSAQLVYATAGAGTSATFVAGTTTHLIVSAAASSPGVGGVTLSLAFPQGGPDCTATTGSGTPVTYTLTSPSGTAQTPATFTCGGAAGSATLSICDPGTAGCGGDNAGLAAGVWTISATAAGYSASSTAFAVPNDAVGTGTVTFTAE